jgi:hypothetical protein
VNPPSGLFPTNGKRRPHDETHDHDCRAAVEFGGARTTYKDVWNDVQKPWRPDAEMDYDVQVDGAACDRLVGVQRGYPSAKYRQCMAARHWKFGHLERLPDDAEPDRYDPIPDLPGAFRSPAAGDQRAGRSLSRARYSSVLRGYDLLSLATRPADRDGTFGPNVA